MILLDDRVGSIELLPLFRPFGIDVETTRLDSADAAFMGYGAQGDCMIGIERKRITDLIQSMREKRLSGFQLPKLLADYEHVFLLIEDMFRPGLNGELQTWQGNSFRALYTGGSKSGGKPMMYAEVDNYLNTLALQTGVQVRRAATPQETVAQIVNLYKWFQKKWSDHHSHTQVYAPVPTPKKAQFRHRELTDKQKLCRDFAAQIPGIDTKCEAVMDKFGTTRRMFEASEFEWKQIPGIGDLLAKRITKLLRER